MKLPNTLRRLPALALTWGLVVGLAGCGAAKTLVTSSSDTYPVTSFTGKVHGGQQPVANARIYLYAAGLTGSGTGAVDLLAAHTISTDASGAFSITGDYSCPSATTQVYVVARGGNPGLATGTNNAALVLMAALGDCGNLSSSTFVYVDEVTTVASAWSLSQFLGPGAAIGANATNATGLRNSFLTVQNLVNTSNGVAPGTAVPQGAATETAKINTLANALAPCVNSDGGTACSALFTAAIAGGVTPANTLDAALAIVRSPGLNIDAVYNAAQTQAPFQPTLNVAPNDWTLSITFGACPSGCGGLNQPGALAIDSNGNIWVANYFGAVVSEFTPTGSAVAANGFPGAGLHQSFGVAVDPLNNVWVSNETSVSAANNSRLGSVSKFDSSGLELSGFGYTGGGIYYPQGIASDAAGNIWIANYGDSSASLLASSGAAISGPAGYGQASLPFTSAVAIDASRDAWFSMQQAAARVTPAGSLTSYSCCVDPTGIAIDQSGSAWLADYGGASIVKLNPLGAVTAYVGSPNGTDAAQGIAVDGLGNVWAANFRGNNLTQIAASSASVLSPASGFGRDAALNEPLGIAIDSDGNLWVSNAGGSTLTEMIGLAAPVRTPLLGPPVSP